MLGDWKFLTISRTTLALLLCCLPLALRASQSKPDIPQTLERAFDTVVPKALEAEHIPGAVIAIGRKTASGFETWQKAYGFLQTVPRPIPMPADAIFDMASLTKPIATGTSMMLLAERRKLKLDDPVSTYLPQFKSDSKKAITIRHLMTHTSGLPPYLDKSKQDEIRAANGSSCTTATRAAVRTTEPTHPPGTVVYSCLNAILCAEIIESITGTSLDRFAEQNIFAPLKMSDTSFSPSAALLSRLAPTTRSEHGRGDGGFLAGQVHDPLAALQDGVSGNAGLFSTAADLARFAQMLLNRGELSGVRILSESSVKDMARTQYPGALNSKGVPDERGLLWDIFPAVEEKGHEHPRCFGHTGFTGTALRIYPEQGVYIIALANRVHPDETGHIEEFRKAVFQTAAELLFRDNADQEAATTQAVSTTPPPR